MIVTLTLNPVLDHTLTVPSIRLDRVLRATRTRLDWGGKGFNVSRTLNALGMQSLAMGLVGGATGQMLEQGLVDLGITTDLVRISGQTRTNVVIIDTNAERQLKVNEAGPTVQPGELAALYDRIQEMLCPGDLWILSGSLPPGAPPDTYARLIDLVHDGGAKVLLDTSGEPLRLGCAAHPFLVKPNVVEAEEVIGNPIRVGADALESVQWFLEQGIEWVALSLGADGLYLASSNEIVRAIPPQVRVRNSVGAGDAMLAGVAWALVQALPLEEVARWGVAAGTAAAMEEGVGIGTRTEVERLYEQVCSQGWS